MKYNSNLVTAVGKFAVCFRRYQFLVKENINNHSKLFGIEVFTMMSMISPVSWDVMTRNPKEEEKHDA
jgi:hypothetical protein